MSSLPMGHHVGIPKPQQQQNDLGYARQYHDSMVGDHYTASQLGAYQNYQHRLMYNTLTAQANQPSVPRTMHGGTDPSAMYFPKKRGRKPLADKGKKRRKRNRPGSHVKRAKTAYFFFLDVFRKNYVKDGDQIPRASEITKACGMKWTSMTVTEKEPYQEKAGVDRKRYEAEISVYRKVRDPDKPKKPPTAYFYFLTDFREQMKGKTIEKGRRLTEICGEEWNKLTDEQKKPYLERVALEYKTYQGKMEDWRKKKGLVAATSTPRAAPQPQPQPVIAPPPPVVQHHAPPTMVPHNPQPSMMAGMAMAQAAQASYNGELQGPSSHQQVLYDDEGDEEDDEEYDDDGDEYE
ncbi:high mobility group protein B1 isoform X5 [Strongylocentrotus purpuratus]|uniref:HMG box domain-containing protein n=1 Tax=Strongylocentrotus purpuratus TaxID=7668 RepID=A0A7M7MXM2_STRPU|nr:high mobility group protein B1 isoform X5 [Strongylocentrotus purpuratus]